MGDEILSITFVGDFKPDVASTRSIELGTTTVVGNLECAFKDGASNRSGKAHVIALPEKYIDQIFDFNFSILGIANNHVADAGEGAFAQLVSRLNGSPKPTVAGLASNPVVEFDHNGARCAVIACLEPCRARLDSITRQEDVTAIVARIRSEFDHVFITPHWGKESEYCQTPSPAQQRLAREWIEAGASGIIGHHPHVVQGMEYHKGCPIFYSTGNFCFQHEESDEHTLTKNGLLVHFDTNRTIEGNPWSYTPVLHTKLGTAPVTNDDRAEWDTMFHELSESMQDDTSLLAWFSWARKIAPTYLEKSSKSWKKRFSKSGKLKTTLIWLAWNCLPTTILLRVASLKPDMEAQETKITWENFIQSKTSSSEDHANT